jgi:hypothetical protein
VKQFYLSFFCFGVLTCCQDQPDVVVSEINTDTISTQTDSIVEPIIPQITVHDSSDYAIDFLNALSEHPMDNLELKDDVIIVNGSDTVHFPEYPEAGEPIMLTGRTDDLAIALRVERISLTTIEYDLEMVEFGEANHFRSGVAVIHAFFYMGSEMDENSATGTSYQCFEYEEHIDGCATIIRLGKESDKGPLLARLICNCNGKIRDITLDDFNTLREK